MARTMSTKARSAAVAAEVRRTVAHVATVPAPAQGALVFFVGESDVTYRRAVALRAARAGMPVQARWDLSAADSTAAELAC